MKKTQENPNLTWVQVNNIVPIVMIIITSLLGYGATLTRISVIETKLDTLIAQQNTIIDKYSSLESRYGTLSIKVNTLEVKNGIK